MVVKLGVFYTYMLILNSIFRIQKNSPLETRRRGQIMMKSKKQTFPPFWKKLYGVSSL